MKLFACCTDPDCQTYKSMLLTLSLWLPKPTPQRQGNRLFFDATPGEGWTIRRLDRFREMIRAWPKGH